MATFKTAECNDTVHRCIYENSTHTLNTHNVDLTMGRETFESLETEVKIMERLDSPSVEYRELTYNPHFFIGLNKGTPIIIHKDEDRD